MNWLKMLFRLSVVKAKLEIQNKGDHGPAVGTPVILLGPLEQLWGEEHFESRKWWHVSGEAELPVT